MNSLEREKTLTLKFNNDSASSPLVETGANFLKNMVRKRRTEKENGLLYLRFKNIY